MTVGSTTDHIETVVIGAGQAGLATGKLLADNGREFVILDALHRVGDNWRRHYDSLRLYSPACLDGLPGMDFPADRYHHPTRDEVADFLEVYAGRFDLPVRIGVRIDRVTAVDGGGYVVTARDVAIEADNVVVATGTFGRPHTPDFARELDPGTVQMHSSRYRNPTDLQPGRVLVVGAAHAGADIALEAARAGHETTLVGRNTGQIPVDIEGRAMPLVTRLESFLFTKVLTRGTPMGRKVRQQARQHGGPLLRVRRKDLQDVGVRRLTQQVVGVRDGRPVLDDGHTIDADTVVWCTGYRQDFSWIDVPVFAADGWPRECRGVVPDAPGLYFVGLAFQYSFASMLLLGVGEDARHVVEHIMAHRAVGARRPRSA